MAELWEEREALIEAEMEQLSDSDLANYIAHTDMLNRYQLKVPDHFKLRTDKKMDYAVEEYSKRRREGNEDIRELYYNTGMNLLDKARTVEQPNTPVDKAHRHFLRNFGDKMPASFVELTEGAFPPQNEQNYDQGGPVMPGLGFRPLGYRSGGILDQSDLGAISTGDLGAISTGDLGAISTAPVSQNAPDTLEYQFLRAVEEGPDIALAFARTYKDELSSMVQNNAFDRAASAQIFMQMLSSGALEGGPIGAGMDMPYPPSGFEEAPMAPMEGLGVYGTEASTLPRSSDRDIMRILEEQPRLSEEITGNIGRTYGTEYPAGLGLGPDVTPEAVGNMGRIRGPYMQAGGYVDHGTVAGELGRRGRLPVQKAGENLYERRKQVKEEQGTGTDLAKRHEAPNWYELMGKRPTLGPRRRA